MVFVVTFTGKGDKTLRQQFFAGRVFVLEINNCDTLGFVFWNVQPTLGNRAGDIFPQQTLTAFCPKISSLPKKERGKIWQDVSCWDCWIFVGVTSICHSFQTGNTNLKHVGMILVRYITNCHLTNNQDGSVIIMYVFLKWAYSPPTNSEITICSFLWRAPI